MKIAIIGYSGSGKSTLATALAARLKIEALHLDTLHFLPGWTERSPREEQQLLAGFLDTHDSWVIDGNYSKNNYARRMKEADRIIFMNFNRLTCFCRALKRYLTYRGRTRGSVAPGCPEKFDREFMLWILRDGRSSTARKRYASVCAEYSGKTTIIRSQRQLERFMKSLEGSLCSNT